jgi:hypothetical protein
MCSIVHIHSIVHSTGPSCAEEEIVSASRSIEANKGIGIGKVEGRKVRVDRCVIVKYW